MLIRTDDWNLTDAQICTPRLYESKHMVYDDMVCGHENKTGVQL